MLNNKLNAALFKIVIFLLVLGGLWLSPLSTPTLRLSVLSDMASQSQLYTSPNGMFSEENSETQPLTVGKTDLRFGLANAASPVRWDPVQSSANINVSHISITVAGIEVPGTNIDIQPTHQIATLSKAADGYVIAIPADANDPQVLIQFNDNNIGAVKLSLCMVLATLISLIIHYKRTINPAINRYSTILNNQAVSLKAHIIKQGFSKKEFFTLFLLATLLNSYFITTLSLSVDDEMGALRTDPEIWISQGRWAVYLIERFLLPLPAIPFIPYLIFDAALAVSYMAIIRAHGAIPSWKTYVAFPVFCSFPTWWLISEFSSNVPAVALGLLLTALSAYLSAPALNLEASQKSKLKSFAICLMLATAIASYQSLILFYLSVGLGVLLVGVISTPNNMTYWIIRGGLRYLFLAIGSMISYFLINKVFQEVSGSYSAYLSGFIKLDQLIEQPLTTLIQITNEAKSLYFGSAYYFGASIGLAPFMLLATTLVILITTPRTNKLLATLMWLLVLTTPFLLHFLAGAGGMPMRTMITLAYVAWLMVFISLTAARTLSPTVFAPLVIIYTIQLLDLNSQYMASATLTQKHDELLAADIYRRIGEIDRNFDITKPVKIDFYGHKKFETVYAKAWSSTTQASFFDWDNGNILRILTYMKILGYQNLHAVDGNTGRALTPVFMTMPVWPALGSVMKQGDTYLVRLSKDADPAHY
ncbi:glucosyltransferase domain-containing protein [Pseudomonas tremae]|uniref:glucosyltransferase domain-containing protein n=1 Tax=Pseudomonas tremae TaxID=200454 RepID=UPI002109CBDB|nr:glucosyltransferase domain-containing protein [Pseudomonas tremae]MCQ3027272.1 glucosyltransferase domain-containing protein [Pseudomonas tremae]